MRHAHEHHHEPQPTGKEENDVNMSTINLSRRGFVKGTAALAAASAVAGSLTYKPVKAFANTPNAAV